MAARILIDTAVPPSGSGCVECLASGGWWFHLRRCARCGHIGCCDSSPSQHASRHAAAAGHPIVQSYEPGEDWFWDYATERFAEGPALAPPAITRSTSPCRDQWVACPETGSDSCTDLFCQRNDDCQPGRRVRSIPNQRRGRPPRARTFESRFGRDSVAPERMTSSAG